MIRIVIIDGRALAREGLHLLIEQEADLTVVQTAACGGDLDATRGIESCDVAVINIDTQIEDIQATATALRRRFPTIGMVALGGDCSDRVIARLLEAKIQGLVIRDEDFAAVRDAIHGVHAGNYCYSRRARDRLVDAGADTVSGSDSTRLQALTRRERELLRLLACGLSLKAAGEEMQVSYKTADKHRVNLMRKLGLHDRVALARYAIREGIVDP